MPKKTSKRNFITKRIKSRKIRSIIKKMKGGGWKNVGEVMYSDNQPHTDGTNWRLAKPYQKKALSKAIDFYKKGPQNNNIVFNFSEGDDIEFKLIPYEKYYLFLMVRDNGTFGFLKNDGYIPKKAVKEIKLIFPWKNKSVTKSVINKGEYYWVLANDPYETPYENPPTDAEGIVEPNTYKMTDELWEKWEKLE